MFTHPDPIGQLAAEQHRHMLAEARQRTLRHQHGHRSSRMPSVGVKIARRLATAITRASAAASETPAADLNQLFSESYPGERLADEFHQRCRDARTVLRQMTHMGN